MYSTGSIETLPETCERFATALSMASLPAFSLTTWPNFVAESVGLGAAWKLEEPARLRLAAFVAVYVFLAVVLHAMR